MRTMAIAVLILVVAVARARAQHEDTDLAKASQNPVGELTSIPLQFNFNTGGGLPPGRAIANLNVQPVFPLKLDSRWTIIARTIVPFLNVPVGRLSRVQGTGDVLQQFFLTPQKPQAFIWGVGPLFSLPTATNDLARTGSWATGPVAVWMITPGHFTIGSLLYNLWTFSDDDGDGIEVNQFAIQPIVNYNLPLGWAISFVPTWTANWDAEGDQSWTIPIGLGVSRVTTVGSQAVSLGVQYYNNVERPDGVNAHQVRFNVNLLFPVKQPAGATTANGARTP